MGISAGRHSLEDVRLTPERRSCREADGAVTLDRRHAVPPPERRRRLGRERAGEADDFKMTQDLLGGKIDLPPGYVGVATFDEAAHLLDDVGASPGGALFLEAGDCRRHDLLRI